MSRHFSVLGNEIENVERIYGEIRRQLKERQAKIETNEKRIAALTA